MKLWQQAGLLGCVLLLSACSFGPVKESPVSTYRLSATATMPVTGSKPQAATLMVMPVTSTRGFDSSDMLYQKKPYQLAAFVENAWVAPPANMITPLLLQSLQQSNLFQAVILGPAMNSTTYTLNAVVLGLYQDFTVDPSQVVLSLNVSLGNNQTNQVVADHTFTIRVKTTANDPYAGVLAANQALTEALTDVDEFISQTGAGTSASLVLATTGAT